MTVSAVVTQGVGQKQLFYGAFILLCFIFDLLYKLKILYECIETYFIVYPTCWKCFKILYEWSDVKLLCLAVERTFSNMLQ